MQRNETVDKVLLAIDNAAEVTDALYSYYRIPEDSYEIVVAARTARIGRDHPYRPICLTSESRLVQVIVASRTKSPLAVG